MQYFLRVLKNVTDVCRVYWCWDSLIVACLWTESFSPPKWFVSDKSFPINDLCMMHVWQIVIRLWIQNFSGQTRTFPSRGQRIYSKFTLASYGNKMRQTELKASVSLPPSKQLLCGFIYWCYIIITHLSRSGVKWWNVIITHLFRACPVKSLILPGKSRFDLVYILYILTVSTLLPFTLYRREL